MCPARHLNAAAARRGRARAAPLAHDRRARRHSQQRYRGARAARARPPPRARAAAARPRGRGPLARRRARQPITAPLRAVAVVGGAFQPLRHRRARGGARDARLGGHASMGTGAIDLTPPARPPGRRRVDVCIALAHAAACQFTRCRARLRPRPPASVAAETSWLTAKALAYPPARGPSLAAPPPAPHPQPRRLLLLVVVGA